MSENSEMKKLNRERYDQRADAYVQSRTHAAGPDLERLMSWAALQPGLRVLDIATGGGHTALALASLGAEVVAVDMSLPMLGVARSYLAANGAGAARFSVSDAENLPFAPQSFDLVSCRIAAHHFPNVFRFLMACWDVLRPGGRLLLQDQVLPDFARAARYIEAFEKLRDPGHVRAFDQPTWLGLVSDAGFTVLQHDVLAKRHSLLDWAQRQGCPPDVTERLQIMLLQAPTYAARHMLPEYAGTAWASFCNHHILILAQKPALST